MKKSVSRISEATHEIFQIKVGSSGRLGWSPRIRQHFGYFTPDEWYEAVVFRLINNDTEWLDVGCGKDLFPSNRNLAEILSARCRLLVGVDPDDNIKENDLLHEKRQCAIEEYDTTKQFDVVTVRMVAEHVVDPQITISVLNKLTRSGGNIVIYTVSKHSPVSLIAAMTPIAFHRAIKTFLWRTSPEDTFPTVFRMNTRKELLRLFSLYGFAEEKFLYLNDCRVFERWKYAMILELAVERALRAVGLRYPEVCLLGVYRKQQAR